MYQVVPIERPHRAYVEDTFLRSVSESWPFNLADWSKLREDLRRQLRRPEVRSGVMVLKSDHDTYLGWAAVVPVASLVLFAYTTAAYRTRPGFEPRIASTLVTELGIDLTTTVYVRYWTKAAAAIAGHPGWHLRRYDGFQ